MMVDYNFKVFKSPASLDSIYKFIGVHLGSKVAYIITTNQIAIYDSMDLTPVSLDFSNWTSKEISVISVFKTIRFWSHRLENEVKDGSLHYNRDTREMYYLSSKTDQIDVSDNNDTLETFGLVAKLSELSFN